MTDCPSKNEGHGKGTTQRQAIEEILAFPKDSGLRNHVEYLLYRWHIYLDTQEELSTEPQINKYLIP